MRIALASVLIIVLCLAGYGVAFQAQVSERSETPAGSKYPQTNVQPNPLKRLPPVSAPVRASAGQALYTAPAPVVEDPAILPTQQLVVLISKSGLRFLSPRTGLDILDDAELQTDGLLVLCDSADVTTDKEGKPEVVCHAAAVIKAAGMSGKAGQLRYKAGCLVLEGDDSDCLITRSKGDKTIFMLRAKTINVNLHSQQIEGSDGSIIQLKPESRSTSETSLEPSKH